MTDYYEILGLKKGSSDQEIKKAYRKLAMQYHPDRNAGDKASEAKFKQISEAYAVLSDKEKKNQYDTYGSNDFHQRYSSDDIFRGADFSSIFSEFGFGGAGGGGDIFSQLFGGGHGGRQHRGYQRGPSKGQNVEYPLSIEFMEAYEGTERNIRFSLQGDRGPERNISIKVPKGMESGKKLRELVRGRLLLMAVRLVIYLS